MLHYTELSEFVFQLDEEIEGMQAVLLQLEHQTKSSGNLKQEVAQPQGQASLNSSNKSSSSNSRERTGRATPNGPLDAHSTPNGGSSLSSKVHVVASRSQT